MAECIYKRNGMGFKAYIYVTANVDDTITIIGPDAYTYQFKMGSSGNSTIAVTDKGNYSVSASESGLSVSLVVAKSKQTYNADVSFKQTVTINANPGVTVTLTNTSGSTVKYTAVANSNGVATVTVKRKGSFAVSSTAITSKTVLSALPASSGTIACNTKGGKASVNYVRVSDISSITVGMFSSSGLTVYLYWSQASSTYWTGVRAVYAAGSTPGNMNSGTVLGDGNGISRTIKKGTTVASFVSGALTANTNYGFRAASYVTINGTKYYGTARTATYLVSNKGVSNSAKGSSGSMTVPDGCWSMSYCLIGGGGGGGASSGKYNGGGGGGGGYVTKGSASVQPGDTISWSIGSGGGQAAGGGTTTLNRNGSKVASAAGGKCGTTASGKNIPQSGGNGGAGGGCGSFRTSNNSSTWYTGGPGAGGSNGGSGKSAYDGSYGTTGGSGQGADAVTYNGVAYGGGGGGGGGYWSGSNYGGAGGTTGGGKGGWYQANGSNGTGGTGGGGGGAGGYASAGSGGSGLVILSFW